MFDITYLAEFSRSHCVALCAFLVPANLVSTALVLLALFLRHPYLQLSSSSLMASGFACLLLLHVATWLMIGVVMAPTFILLGLGLTCLAINFQVLTDAQGLEKLIGSLLAQVKSRLLPLSAK